MRPTLLIILLLCMAMALSLETPLMAQGKQPTAAARRQSAHLFKQGMKLFGKQRYYRAIKKFERAHELHARPNRLYNMGEAYRRLGKRRESHAYYSRFAESMKPDKRIAFLEKLETLRTEVPCDLSMATNPGGARVAIDGKASGKTPADGSPLKVRVPGGSHEIRVQLKGHEVASWKVMAEFGEPQALNLTLKVLPRPTRLVVECNVPGAAVLLDGKPWASAGSVPMERALSSGEHTVRIHKEGYTDLERTLTLQPGQTERLVANLQPVPPPVTAPAASAPDDKPDSPASQPKVKPGESEKPPGSGLFVMAMMGPAWADYDRDVDVGVGLQFGARAGWLWRRGRIGLHLDATALFYQVDDQSPGGQAAWFITFLGGVGARFYFWQDLWAGLRFGAGVTTLQGAALTSGLFFGDAAVVDGAFAMLALRPEVTAGWTLGKGLSVYLTPFALDYSPAHEKLTGVGHIMRFHVGMGAGWQM